MKPITLKLVMVAILTLVLCLNTSGQLNNDKLERLNIGDKIPDYPLVNLVNYPAKTARISDFQGKLLILDYWFTGCGPCIASWPKLMKLQKQFKDEIQIILVNHMENESTVRDFIEKRKKKSNLDFDLPSVTGDSILHKVLPPTGYPSIIWIDENGIFKAATSGGELNEKNIQALLNGNTSSLNSLKWLNRQNSSDFSLPIFNDGNQGLGKNMLWYSRLSTYSEGGHNGAQRVNADSQGYYIIAGNKSILDLLRMSYGKGRDEFGALNDLPHSRLKLQSNDSSRYMHAINGIMQFQNLYTYQLISKEPKTKGQLKEIMQDDLKKYFDLIIEWKKEKKKCLVLKTEDTTVISKFKGGKKFRFLNTKDGMVLDNMPVEIFLNVLRCATNLFYSPYPIIDETNFKGRLDIVFGKEFENVNDLADYQALNKALQKYKMNFTLQDREVNILNISESENYKPVKRELTEDQKIAQVRAKDRQLVINAASAKDWDAYKKHFIYFVNTYLMDDYSQLNAHAWEFYQNEFITDEASLNQALKWVKRSIELHGYYANHDTHAAILYKLDRKDEALAAAQKALKMYNSAGMDASQTKELIEKIKKMH